MSFFTFTCCYSKISCLNRHLGSTLPTSQSCFNSTTTDELFLRIFLFSFSSFFIAPPLRSLAKSFLHLLISFILLLFFVAFILPVQFTLPSFLPFSSWLFPWGNHMPMCAYTPGIFSKKSSCTDLLWGSDGLRYSWYAGVPNALLQLIHF